MIVEFENIVACNALAESIRSTLGPFGADKLLVCVCLLSDLEEFDVLQVDSDGDLAVTSDGATILKHLQIEHPAAQILATAALAQDENVGDGTTSMVLLASAFLSAAMRLMKTGIHPSQICRAFEKAMTISLSAIRSLYIQISDSDLNEKLVDVASTCLGSRLVGGHFAAMAVAAASHLRGSTHAVRQRLHVAIAPGGSLHDSFLVPDGIVLERAASASGPQSVRNAHVAVTRLQLDGAGDTGTVRSQCEQLIAAGATVVINQGLVYPEAEQMLAQRGVMCVSNAGFDGVYWRGRCGRILCPIPAAVERRNNHNNNNSRSSSKGAAATVLSRSLGAAVLVECVRIGERSFVKVAHILCIFLLCYFFWFRYCLCCCCCSCCCCVFVSLQHPLFGFCSLSILCSIVFSPPKD